MLALIATNAREKRALGKLFGPPLASDRETETYSFSRWLESRTVTAQFPPTFGKKPAKSQREWPTIQQVVCEMDGGEEEGEFCPKFSVAMVKRKSPLESTRADHWPDPMG